VEDGRTGGGRRRKADTELKTKTPHVNVGKNVEIDILFPRKKPKFQGYF
jgi:hypothetical protein